VTLYLSLGGSQRPYGLVRAEAMNDGDDDEQDEDGYCDVVV